MEFLQETNESRAAAFCEALRKFAENPEAIDNLQSYLERHFESWFFKYAGSPDGIISELKHFSMII